MISFTSVLVSMDTRTDDQPALRTATALAEHTGAKLHLVTVLPEFSWYVRLALDNPDEMREAMLHEARERLNHWAITLRRQGLTVETTALWGRTSLEILKYVDQRDISLVIRVNKGPQSRREGRIGNTSLNLLRKCPCPVWIVRPDSPAVPQRIVAAVDPTFDDEPHRVLCETILKTASAVAELHQGHLDVLHAWNVFADSVFSPGPGSDGVDQYGLETQQRIEDAVDDLLKPHGLSVGAENVHLVKGEPYHVIPQFVATHGIELLVMGTVGRSGLAGLVIGNTAEIVLDRVTCDILALKASPVTLPSS